MKIKSLIFDSKYLLIVFFLLIIYHGLGTAKYLYWRYWWYDLPAHFGGGVLTALFFIIFLKNRAETANLFFRVLFLMSFAALIGVLWEFFEKGLDYFFALSAQGNLNDTLLDLAMDLLGAFFTAIFSYPKLKKWKIFDKIGL